MIRHHRSLSSEQKEGVQLPELTFIMSHTAEPVFMMTTSACLLKLAILLGVIVLQAMMNHAHNVVVVHMVHVCSILLLQPLTNNMLL